MLSKHTLGFDYSFASVSFYLVWTIQQLATTFSSSLTNMRCSWCTVIIIASKLIETNFTLFNLDDPFLQKQHLFII